MAAVPKSLLCAVCRELYSTPKLLQCGHSFCEQCCAGCIVGKSIRCAICRGETELPRGIVAGLPTNYALKELLDEFRSEATELREKDLASQNKALCEKHSSEEITQFCVDCSELVCNKCVRDTHLRHSFDDPSKARQLLLNSLKDECGIVQDCVAVFERAARDASQRDAELSVRTESQIERVNDLIEMLHSRLDQLRIDLITKLAADAAAELHRVAPQYIHLDRALADSRALVRDANAAMKRATVTEMIVAKRRCEAALDAVIQHSSSIQVLSQHGAMASGTDLLSAAAQLQTSTTQRVAQANNALLPSASADSSQPSSDYLFPLDALAETFDEFLRDMSTDFDALSVYREWQERLAPGRSVATAKVRCPTVNNCRVLKGEADLTLEPGTKNKQGLVLGVAFDEATQRVYLSDAYRNAIKTFTIDSSTSSLTASPIETLIELDGNVGALCRVQSGRKFITTEWQGNNRNSLVVISERSGVWRRHQELMLDEPTEWLNTAVAETQRGDLLVTCRDFECVFQFVLGRDDQYELLRKLNLPAKVRSFSYSRRLDRFACTFTDATVRIFGRDGRMAQLIRRRDVPSWNPWFIALAKSGVLFVNDWSNQAIECFDLRGTLLGRVIQNVCTYCLAIDEVRNRLLVFDDLKKTLNLYEFKS